MIHSSDNMRSVLINKIIFLFFGCILLTSSCQCYDNVVKHPVFSEELDGLLLITRRACFFVPYENCKYLEYNNLENEFAKAVIIDHIENKEEIASSNQLTVQVALLPNKDSSDVIVQMDYGFCRNELLKENECQIIPVTAAMLTYIEPIDLLSDRFLFKFIWDGNEYHYECINRGNHVCCKILSQNERLQNWIQKNHKLPIGIVKK